jgi:hypothetical protein
MLRLNAGTITQNQLDALNIPGASIVSDFTGRWVTLPSGVTGDQIAALTAITTAPPPAPSLPGPSPAQIAASDTWAALNAQLAGLPPPATPDPYANLRSRLGRALTAAKSQADDLGGLA